jgi:hypothetical protein
MKADDADEVIAAVATNEAVKADEFCATDKAGVNDQSDVNKAGVCVKLPLLLLFSLTKYFEIFAEVKGCFGIFNNQLGRLNCLIILNKEQQEILCVQCCHNCWIVMDVKQRETWCANYCSRNC